MLLPGPASVGLNALLNAGSALAGQVPIADGLGGAPFGYPPGFEFDYAQVTSSPPTISATTAATAQVIIQGNAVVYGAITRVKVETGGYDCNNQCVIELYDGATDLGRMTVISGAASGGTWYSAQFVTLSAASHTLSINGWKIGSNVTFDVGTGGPNTVMPLWYRVTKA